MLYYIAKQPWLLILSFLSIFVCIHTAFIRLIHTLYKEYSGSGVNNTYNMSIRCYALLYRVLKFTQFVFDSVNNNSNVIGYFVVPSFIKCIECVERVQLRFTQFSLNSNMRSGVSTFMCIFHSSIV